MRVGDKVVAKKLLTTDGFIHMTIAPGTEGVIKEIYRSFLNKRCTVLWKNRDITMRDVSFSWIEKL